MIRTTEWKNEVIAHKYALKRLLIKNLTRRIAGLEEMVAHLTEAYNSLTAHCDKLCHDSTGKKSSFTIDSSFSRARVMRPLHGSVHSHALSSNPAPSSSGVPQRRANRAKTIMHKKDPMESMHFPNSEVVQESVDQHSFGGGHRSRNYETNLYVQKMQNVQLKAELEELRTEAARHKEMMEKAHSKLDHELKAEFSRWKVHIDEYKLLTDSELERKQTQLLKMNEVLSSWIHRYLQLQEDRGHHRRTKSGVPIEPQSPDMRNLCRLTTEVLVASKELIGTNSPMLTGRSTACRSGMATPAVFEMD